jgi:hypothetical protein
MTVMAGVRATRIPFRSNEVVAAIDLSRPPLLRGPLSEHQSSRSEISTGEQGVWTAAVARHFSRQQSK